MNVERPASTSRSSSTTLRPRNRRPANGGGDSDIQNDSLLAPVSLHSRSSSSSWKAPPMTKNNPSTTADSGPTALRSRGGFSNTRSSSLFGTQAGSTAFAGDLWGTTWSSLQGFASDIFGSETGRTSSKASSPNGRRGPSKTRRDYRITPALSKWGPAANNEGTIGTGTEESRRAQVQAKKREALLSANGHIKPDHAGRLKRRDSDGENAVIVSPSQLEDREALVYLHKVKPEDTMAGLSIKYNCQVPVIRKSNNLWPNDRVQIRDAIYLPLDACGVKGHTLPEVEPTVNGLGGAMHEDLDRTPTTSTHPFSPSTHAFSNPSDHKRTPMSSIPTSPSISVTSPPDDPPYVHESWVSLPNFSCPVEIVRLSRRTLGFFPPPRRKSISFSDLDTPPASLEIPRSVGRSSSRRRSNHPSSTSPSDFLERLRGPGGVGTLGREVHSPGPAQDGLNKFFAVHLPNVAPRPSFESAHSNSSTGMENVGGAIEGWMRKVASKAKESVQSPSRGEREREGDLIELSDAYEDTEGRGDRRVREADLDSQPALGTWKDDQERLLRERFPPRGRVFAESPRRKGV